MNTTSASNPAKSSVEAKSNKIGANFLHDIIDQDLASGKHQQIAVRFPPEPNGYLHIGHAKSICLNFGLAQKYGGTCNLRFDDTNPTKEETAFIEAIKQDILWLGFKWDGEVRFTSSYFDELYQYALHLIHNDKAYVCDLTPEQMREYRGTLTSPGINSPYRSRTVAENLDLFARMKSGEFADGSKVLRAKIDMTASNINLRDPILYRIRHATHHQTGDKWCIYPSYDFAHGQSDAIEGITHSICTLEFEDHRPLYEWLLDNLPVKCRPKQYEFARLNLNYCVTSKRKLKTLVDAGYVSGWDDPRMTTLQGMKRRGIPPSAIRNFCAAIGVNRAGGVVDMTMLESFIREELDTLATRAMCVLNPLKVTISNYPADQSEILLLPKHPKQDLGVRKISFAQQIYIDRNDFSENPPKGYKRLELGKEVRLRGAYVLRADKIIKNDSGEIIEIIGSVDLATLGKNPEGRKVKGVIHWVAVNDCIDCEVRLYDRLFQSPNPEAAGDFLADLNPESQIILKGCKAESSLAHISIADRLQFEREGYFCLDAKDSHPDKLVFNRIVTLRDTWSSKA